MTEKIILGIDPGTNIMGYGLIKVTGNKAEMMTDTSSRAKVPELSLTSLLPLRPASRTRTSWPV